MNLELYLTTYANYIQDRSQTLIEPKSLKYIKENRGVLYDTNFIGIVNDSVPLAEKKESMINRIV